MSPTDPAAPRPGRAVITGAAGFIGRRLARAFLDAGWTVTGLDLGSEPEGDVEIVAVDLGAPAVPGSRDPLIDVLSGADVVVHTAAIVADDAEPELAWRVNVGGTARLLSAVEEVGSIGRLVHVSSIVVHGRTFPADRPLPENAPVRMSGSPYTDTKVASEHLVLQAGLRWAFGASPTEVVVARPGDVFGPDSVWARRPVELLRSRLAAAPSGPAVLSPVWVDDLVDGLLRAATVAEAAGGTFTFAAGDGIATREVFERYGAAAGVPVPVLPPPVLRAAGGLIATGARAVGRRPPLVAHSVEYVTHPGTYAIERARTVLGWQPRVSASEAVDRTVAWCVEQGLLGRR